MTPIPKDNSVSMTDYLNNRKVIIHDLLDNNMFYSAILELKETVAEYELRLGRGEY